MWLRRGDSVPRPKGEEMSRLVKTGVWEKKVENCLGGGGIESESVTPVYGPGCVPLTEWLCIHMCKSEGLGLTRKRHVCGGLYLSVTLQSET